MSKQIQSKSRMPKSLCYNAWTNIGFPPQNPPSDPTGETVPLPLNFKIVMLTYSVNVLNTAGGFFANLISGTNAAGYQGTGAQASHGYFDLGGAFATGDVITMTVAGTRFTYTVTSRDTTYELLAASIVASLSYNPAFMAHYRANSLGAEVVIQLNTYSTATPTFAVTTNSVSGTVTPNGANMIAGVAGAVPTQPVSDQTGQGIVPSGTAVDGNALFPVDIVLPMFNLANSGKTGVIYAVENFDAIWPAASSLTFVATNPGIGSANITPAAWGVPVDNHPMQPAESGSYFKLTQNIL